MNKFVKKVVSGFTSLSICTALMMGVPAVADENDGIQTQAQTGSTLSIDFLGRGATPAESSQGDAMLKKADVNNEFWVGVSVDNISDVDLFKNGIYSLDIAFEYNPNYVKPYWNSADAEADWKAEVEKGNLSNTGDVAAWWASDSFDVTSVYECDIDTVGNDRENAAEASKRVADGWKMCYVGITLKDGLASTYTRFMASATATKYLIKLPFTLVGVPAENDPDQNPTVLSLVRGKDTFAIGSGDGTEPYASWYATERPAPDNTNLKNLFTFKGDISLFGQGGAIENIVPVKPAKTQDEQDTKYTLSQSISLGEEGFEAEKTTYYLSVPNETEEICLDITSSVLPTVAANNASVTVNTGNAAKEYRTDKFSLAELDKDVNGGFNNSVTVSAGSKQYEIHIRRLLKPQIKLNYGNSPYGEIMRADNIAEADKQTAKEKFDVNNRYDANYLPTAVVNKSSFTYTSDAWKNDNYDKNDYAIFLYNKTKFRDPGFKAYDALGEEVSENDIEREITVTRLNYDGVEAMLGNKVQEDKITIQNQSEDCMLDMITSSTKNSIQPGVYEMKYSFTDTVSNQKIVEIRPVVLLWDLGDIDMSTIVNPSDVTAEYSVIKGKYDYSKISAETKALYEYRIADADLSTIINPSDITALYSIIKGKVESKIYRVLE